MAIHFSILAWKIPWNRSLVGYSPWGGKRVGHDFATKNNKEKLEGQPDKESCCHSPCAALSGSKHWPQPLIISWGRAQGVRKGMSLCL